MIIVRKGLFVTIERFNEGMGLLGCGAMGLEVVDAVGTGWISNASIVAVHDVDSARAEVVATRLKPRPRAYEDVSQLLGDPEVRLIVECASGDAVRQYGVDILSAGKHLLMISSGALVDAVLFRAMVEAAMSHDCRLIVPSGAIGGIDVLRAARDQLDEVTLVSTKKPEAFSGAPGFKCWEGHEFTKPQVIYEGPVPEAVALFPANVNVAATVSLAGLGVERTGVRVIADPDAPGNVHQVEARGACGEYIFRLTNRPNTRNPRTSQLAVLSVIEALRAFYEPAIRIGT